MGSRRAFLSALVVSGLHAELEKGKSFAAEWKRYQDPATEFDVTRLTDPAHTSRLPAYYNHAVSRRNTFLLYASDRAGSWQGFRLDLKSGEQRELTRAEAMDPTSLLLMPDERSLLLFDGPSLRQVQLANLKGREIYRVPEGWSHAAGLSVTVDGVSAIFAETGEQGSRLRLLGIHRGTVSTITEASFEIADPQPRPRRAQVLYRDGAGALWLVNFDGRQNRRLKTAPGGIGPAMWAPGGRTVLYLNFPEDKTKLNAIRELTPDENQDKLLSTTSQFVHFGPNGDASVFVGASRNRASPHILLLLRMTRRELTVCEHAASNPAMVAPIFSPDSQKIFFHSDRDGKAAIYRVQVERFVEKTEES